MQSLLAYIQIYHQLSAEAVCAIEDNFEKILLSKNDFLLQEGKICKHLYFLEAGAVRGFYNVDGKEVTHWFGFEDTFVTSFHSFITQKPALENMQLLEGCVLWKIEKSKLETLCDAYHEVERLLRKAYENYYIKLEERYVNAQFRTATERYQALLTTTPHILSRVPLGMIASYLGVSQETLSRVRSGGR